jgi:hypothetical protein
MKLCRNSRLRLGGYTRRELIAGAGVVLALFAVTASELRHRNPPSCGAACSPCGGEAAGGLERWVAAQTNATTIAPAPAPAVR